MASFRFEVSPEWDKALMKLDTLYDDTCEEMLNTGGSILAEKLKRAGSQFAEYIKLKKAKRNQYGWFAQIQFRGKTSSGEPAALAASVYEYGRQGYHPQQAKPFVRPTAQAAEKEVVDAMQNVLEEALKKI
jgi:hypothetical protein